MSTPDLFYLAPFELPQKVFGEYLETGVLKAELTIRGKDEKQIKTLFESRRISENLNIVSCIDNTELIQSKEKSKVAGNESVQSERMKSLELLAGSVAHDLNNSLGPVVGYSDMLLAGIDENDKMGKRIKGIREAAHDANAIIQDLLILARRDHCEMEKAGFIDVVKSYMESPQYSELVVKNPDIHFSVLFDDNIDSILCSPSHLCKLIDNIVHFSIESMPDGGELTIQTSQNIIDLSVDDYTKIKPGEYVLLSVKDTGIGIDSKDIDKIFEPYYVPDNSMRRGDLSLSAVYGIVKKHKGYIDVKSGGEKGKVIAVYLPVLRDGMNQSDVEQAEAEIERTA